MRITKKRVREGEALPVLYRISYEDYLRREVVCYPIGIHWVVKVCRRIWEWSFRYRSSSFESELSEALKKGYEQGLEQGRGENASLVKWGEAIRIMRDWMRENRPRVLYLVASSSGGWYCGDWDLDQDQSKGYSGVFANKSEVVELAIKKLEEGSRNVANGSTGGS